MTARLAQRTFARRRFAMPAGGSIALHLLVATALILARPRKQPALPPIYKVDIVAAPPGPRVAGVVTPDPVPPAAKPAATPPPRAETKPTDMPLPTKTPPRRVAAPPATPVPIPAKEPPKATEPAPHAGGGPTGGTGTDVATVRTEGIDFPYPQYLNNIVRQIAKNFHPDNPNAPLSADVMFLIRRDGSVTGIQFRRKSGSYAFDLEAQGAIEAAGNFGPLPAGFSDDVLPVIFSFDPRVLR